MKSHDARQFDYCRPFMYFPSLMSRPSIYSEDVAERICDRIANGESLRTICSGDDVPSRPTVNRWLASDTSFQGKYAVAKQWQIEGLLDEVIEIADDSTEDVRRLSLQVKTRFWLVDRLMPKKYGRRCEAELRIVIGGAAA